MNKRTAVFGIILILLGFIFWLNQLDVLDVSFGDIIGFLLPLGLIGAGIWLILRHRRQTEKHSDTPRYDYQFYEQQQSQSAPGASTASQSASAAGTTAGFAGRVSASPSQGGAGKLRYDKFMGDLFIDCRDITLQNVEVSSFIGDVEIKIHGGKLAPGLNRMIVSGFIGDVRILVPPDLPVFVQASNFVGDTELFAKRTSGFGNSLDAQTADYSSAESKLYIAINFFISDIRVYEV